jgi:AraC family L-rhamnose operon transcriptional activator RhaR
MDDTINYYLDGSIFRQGINVYLNEVIVSDTTKPHAHDFIEIAYVSKGEGTHRIGSMQTECKSGDYFIINYNVPHEFICTKSEMLIYNCIFRPEFIDYSMLGCKDFNNITSYYLIGSLSPPSGLSLLNMKFQDNDQILNLFLYMLDEYKTQKPGYVQIIRANLIELLVKTLRSYDTNKPSELLNKDHYIYNVVTYISEHYSLTLPLDELAMMAFLSPAHFCRQFKKFTGMTVTEFTKKIRVEEAAHLLLNTDNKIMDIAEHVGYHDIKHFSKVFISFMGDSPSKYRKKSTENHPQNIK